MRFRNGPDKGTASEHQILCKSRKMCDGDLAIIRQAFEEESMSLRECFNGMLGSGPIVYLYWIHLDQDRDYKRLL
jgi:hypothetical protein